MNEAVGSLSGSVWTESLLPAPSLPPASCPLLLIGNAGSASRGVVGGGAPRLWSLGKPHWPLVLRPEWIQGPTLPLTPFLLQRPQGLQAHSSASKTLRLCPQASALLESVEEAVRFPRSNPSSEA